MNRWALAVTFVAGFATALAGTVPMSLALREFGTDKFGISAAEISGSIWSGRLQEANYRGLPLGSVRLALDPFALLTGSWRVAVSGPLGKFTLVRGSAYGFETADAAIAIEHLRLVPGFTGQVRLENAAVLFSDGRCSRAEGRIATDTLEHAFRGPQVSGALSCGGDVAIAQLNGQTPDSDIRVTLHLDGRGQYAVETQVVSSNPAVRGALALAGFAERANGFVRLDEGALGS